MPFVPRVLAGFEFSLLEFTIEYGENSGGVAGGEQGTQTVAGGLFQTAGKFYSNNDHVPPRRFRIRSTQFSHQVFSLRSPPLHIASSTQVLSDITPRI